MTCITIHTFNFQVHPRKRGVSFVAQGKVKSSTFDKLQLVWQVRISAEFCASGHINMTCSADMQNITIVPSAVFVNFQGLGKLLALTKRCFVVKLLFVALLRSFQLNCVGKVKFYWELWGKMGENGCNFG